MGKLISFCIPCYRGGETIEKVIAEAKEVVAQRPDFECEFVCVNDCSPDNEYEVLCRLAAEDKHIKVINFGKNMGKHAGVLASYSVLDKNCLYVVNLDDDYQCPTYELWKFIDLLEADECDIAMAHYEQKKESPLRLFGSNLNFKMTNMMLDKPKEVRGEPFFVTKVFVAKEMMRYRHPYPFIEGLMYRASTRIKTVDVEQRERADEKGSGFTLKRSIALWVDGLTAFSVKPLRIASITGCAFAIFGFILGIVTIIRRLIGITDIIGYSSIAAILLFATGVIMLMLGLIGEYIGRIYICINDAPQYVIKNTINVDRED